MPTPTAQLPRLDTHSMLAGAEVTAFRYSRTLRLLYGVLRVPAVALPFVRALRNTSGLVLVPAGRIRLVLPAQWLASPPHALLYKGPSLYRAELEAIGNCLRKVPNTTELIVDVGANVGFHALRMRDFCDNPILCFEPSPLTFDLLSANLQINRATHPNITALNVACSNTPGSALLACGFNSYICESDINPSHIFPVGGTPVIDAIGSAVGRTAVTVVRLDDALPARARVGFLKIDVEGFEHRVLEGARATIARDLPSILVELHPKHLPRYGSSVSLVCTMLRSFGYHLRFFDFSPPEPSLRVARVLRRYLGNPTVEYETEHQAAAGCPDAVQLHALATRPPRVHD